MNNRYIQIQPVADPNPSLFVRPSDWIDISTVGNNEINILVTESVAFAFKVNTASGTFSVDWGDGSVQTGLVSGVLQQHVFTSNGTPCSLGYNTWKVRIYGASANITGFTNSRHTLSGTYQNSPILDIVFGTYYLQTLILQSNANPGLYIRNLKSCTLPLFYASISLMSLFSNAASLQEVILPSSFGNVTSAASMFSGCRSLPVIKLPDYFGNITTVDNMFFDCVSLAEVKLPASWTSVALTSSLFSGCTSLSKVTLPSSWGSVTNASYMFYACRSLKTVNLPSAWSSTMTNLSAMFYNCDILDSITLPASWNNITSIFQMFYNTNIKKITLPLSWGLVSSAYGLFYYCQSLINVTLPASFGSISNASGMFAFCYSLKQINNLAFVGSITVQSDLSDIIKDCYNLSQSYSTNSLISKIIITGTATLPMPLTSIRLTNPGSTFSTSPYINVSYTNLDATALNLLFGDLPTLTGKTINITGCPGAASCTRSIATAKGWIITG